MGLLFPDFSTLYKSFRILILGSYYEPNYSVLTDLKNFFQKKGCEEVLLGNDLNDSQFQDIRNINARNLAKINNAMKNSDINFFLFFDTQQDGQTSEYISIKENESTLTELLSLVSDEYLRENSFRILVFFPVGYHSSMLRGFVSSKDLNIFEYHSMEEICESAFSFLLQHYKILNK